MSLPTTVAPLFTPLQLDASLTLPNRIVMAPMTRCMAGAGLVPTPAMGAYYARRAAAGLIVSEGVIVRPDGQGYPNTPGLFSAAQVAGWQAVVAAVHAAGGRIFAQLWHVGRVSHPTYLDGALPIAPSPVPLAGRVPRTEFTYATPRALALEEIPPVVAAYGHAAANAKQAGFDGVEIHGANGYLIDQFLHHHTNRRTDAYGGTPSRMARFCLEVVDAVAAAMGVGRTGIRLSPAAYHNMEGDPRDVVVFDTLLAALAGRSLAYVHAGIAGHHWSYDDLGGSVAAYLRRRYPGRLVACGELTPEGAAAAVAAGEVELTAFGRPFIANPDLVERLRAGEALKPYHERMLLSLV